MRGREFAAATALVLTAGCSTPDTAATAPTPSAHSTAPTSSTHLTPSTAPTHSIPSEHIVSPHADLSFHRLPGQYFKDDQSTFGDCTRDTHNWLWLGEDAGSEGRGSRFVDTIGVSEHYDAQGSPNPLIAGATIRGLGGLMIEVTTSDNKPNSAPHIVDLSKQSFAQVLSGGEGYDVVFTARVDVGLTDVKLEKGMAFTIQCLPDWDFFGDQKEVPLVPTPQSPSPEPVQPSAKSI